ncbi:hypothetical protein ACHAXA_004253 [Cyclostephanos tholiformis]|uniref:GDT1 family protein n=1 Tax=Cyclostephanos tholiformis TaxID=382380 RepID=A0ABD3RMI9_9STRA
MMTMTGTIAMMRSKRPSPSSRRRPNDCRRPSPSSSRRVVGGNGGGASTLLMIPLAVVFLSLNSSSVVRVGGASSAADPNAVVSFRRVFDAVDSNGDHSITEDELASAIERLVGVGVGVGVGGGGTVAEGGGGRPTPWIGLQSLHGGSDGGGGGRTKGVIGGKFEDPASTTAFLKGLVSSFSAIMATEIGDKTFFIAAVLSMRNDRAAVFGGAILALIVMTILSTLMGLVLPALMPRRYTHLIGGALFLYFGFKLLKDSRGMGDGVSEELEEGARQSSGGLSTAGEYSGNSWESVFLQALTLTFLAEWGDRSQIATIALAAAKDPVGVTIGGCMGHSVCTGMAVVGGRMLASRISEKSVAFYGGLTFLVFGIHSVFFEE